MPTTLIARFATRRDAEMTVEQLVQTHGIDRTMVFVSTVDADNSAGVEPAGSDLVEGRPDPDANPSLGGLVEVSVDLDGEADVDIVEEVFRDHGAEEVDRR